MAIRLSQDECGTSSEGIMRVKTAGLGLVALGILLLGAQLVLYLGAKNIGPPPERSEIHIVPPRQAFTNPLPGILGAMSLIAGLALAARKPEEADDPTDGLTIPGGATKARQTSR
jgi:hypothetical protein